MIADGCGLWAKVYSETYSSDKSVRRWVWTVRWKSNFFILNSGDGFLISGENCVHPCCHNGFKVVMPGRNPRFFMSVTGKDSSCLWVYMGFDGFVCYHSVGKDADKRIVCGAGEHYPATSDFRPWVLVAWGPGVERAAKIMVSLLLFTKVHAAEGHNSACIRRLPDGWRCQRRKQGSCEGVWTEWAGEWGCRKRKWWRRSRDWELLHLFQGPEKWACLTSLVISYFPICLLSNVALLCV